MKDGKTIMRATEKNEYNMGKNTVKLTLRRLSRKRKMTITKTKTRY